MKMQSPYNVVMPGMSYTQINSYKGKPSEYISDLKSSVVSTNHRIEQIQHHKDNIAQGKEFVKNAVDVAGPLDGHIIDAWA